MGAVENVQNRRAVLFTHTCEVGVDVGDVVVGVQSLGESTLVGDEHHFEPRVLRQGQGLHHGRENGEL